MFAADGQPLKEQLASEHEVVLCLQGEFARERPQLLDAAKVDRFHWAN